MNIKKKIIKLFNKNLETLLKQLSPIIGISYYNNFKKIIKINSLYPINFWIENLHCYKKEIISRDESYFIIKECPQSIEDDNIKLNEIFRLKNIYNKFNIESKKNIWLYLQTFVKLADNYINQKLNSCKFVSPF